MARSISDIQQALISQVQSDPILGPLLTNNSRVSIWILFTYCIAVCQWTCENLYDAFVAMVNALLAQKMPHTAQWYASMSKAFLYGQQLIPDSDTYDTSLLTDDQITAAQIISYAAAIEQVVNNRVVLRIKVAKLINGDLGPLSSDELAAFTAYMTRIKDAGVALVITSTIADGLKASIDFYYDPLILNGAGSRNDGTATTPVQDAASNFLSNLPFNGVYSVNQFNDALQGVQGYKDLRINYALTQYGSLPYSAVNINYIPDSGYLRFLNPSTDLLINFIPYSE